MNAKKITRFQSISRMLAPSPSQRLLVLACLALLLAACANQTRNLRPEAAVGIELLPPEDEGITQLKPGESTDGQAGTAEHLPLPEPPARWLDAMQPPLRLPLLVVVDAEGQVSELSVDSREARARCAECAADFAALIQHVSPQWRFQPLEISNWLDVDEDGDGEFDSVRRGVVERRPYSLRLALTFSLVDGRAQVAVASDQSDGAR